MVIHPPSLYTGFVAATIPFAFAIGALASGRLDDLWLGSVRSWMLICFGFLSLGLVLGGRWAYEVLGWGGYWAWDPVENAGFIPWFTATAFLHSAIIQEQRGMMKTWNISLVVITFFLTIFGTFMTRSGVVKSIHAFGEDNVLALQFVMFMAVILIVSIGLIVYRSNQLATKMHFDSFVSREFAFLMNNWILLACAFFVLFATMFPTITEALDGSRVAVGPKFFNKWMTPLGLVLLFLAGAAPLLAWRKTTRERLWNQFMIPTAVAAGTIVMLLIVFPQTTHLSPIFADKIKLPISLINFGLVAFTIASIGQEYWRGVAVRMRQTSSDPVSSLFGLVLMKRRKYGGYIVHLGIALMFLGFAGKAYERNEFRTVNQPGVATADGTGPSSFQYGDYTFAYERLIQTSDDHKFAVTAQVGIYEDGDRVTTRYPAIWQYQTGEKPVMTVPAITVMFTEDVYLVLSQYDVKTGMSNFQVFINPLILWVWLGAIVLLIGTAICLIPQFVVDLVTGWKPKTRVGRAADVGIVLGIVTALVLGVASQARADVPAAAAAAAPAEHVRAGMGMGTMSGGWAAKNRPVNDTQSKAMSELLCPCGCARQSILDCQCQTASELRGVVMETLATADLSTDAGRQQAYDAVLDKFVREYGGDVLATPKSKFSWLLPSFAALGGLGLLVVLGRRWVRGAGNGARPSASTQGHEDDNYAEKLDDELARTD
jgi:cytochrome c-type biogenesis protein CcmF